jgi:hypothetical protein
MCFAITHRNFHLQQLHKPYALTIITVIVHEITKVIPKQCAGQWLPEYYTRVLMIKESCAT